MIRNGPTFKRCLVADFDYHADALANALDPAVIRTFHGCRTDDAGSYFRHGLRIHDRAAMTAQVKAIVDGSEELAWMKSGLDAAIAEIDNRLDPGRLYVVADDTVLLKHAAHYLIYGSEWISAVLGAAGRRVLLRRGAPTLLEIDLPLRMSSMQTRSELATKMLQEWTRLGATGLIGPPSTSRSACEPTFLRRGSFAIRILRSFAIRSNRSGYTDLAF